MLTMLRYPSLALIAVAAALPFVPTRSARPTSDAMAADTVRPELWGVGVVSTAENELNAAFTADGRTVYFTRKGGDGRFAVILESHLGRNGRWSTPAVSSFSGQYPDYDPILTPNGQQLLYISKRPVIGSTPKSDFDIWVVDRTTTGWSAPRRLEAPINSDGDELYPSVATDGTLYFSSCGRSDSKGRCDLYRSRLDGGRYTTPENLGGMVR